MLLHKIGLTAEIEKKQPWRLLGILSLLISFGQKFLLENSGRRRAFSMKSELEKGDDPVHCGIIGYESDHSHRM